MDEILLHLNERQREACMALDGYIRVVAGAGTGKTRALTHRYAYLVSEAGITPANILCVTFTNKAAGEMKRRIRAMLGEGYDTSLITTYHGFAVRILREDISGLFYPENFIILDTVDQKKILEEVFAELDLKLDRATFEKTIDAIGLYKANMRYVSMLAEPGKEIDPDTAASLNERIILSYMSRQKKLYGLDFEDLLNFVLVLFGRRPDVLKKWQERLHYIQVDEFQDSDGKEFKLIESLSRQHKNLFVVGDPDQNIYEWRGADVRLLVDFDKTFPGTRTIIMDRNYRSTPEILAVANSLIQHNQVRIPKDLYTRRGPGQPVEHLHFAGEDLESEKIASVILNHVAKGGRHADIAILYRSSYLSRFIEQRFMKDGIPYIIYGGVRFFERSEIKDALAYLRLIAHGDDLSLMRILNLPRRGIGKVKENYIAFCAKAEGISLYEAVKRHAQDSVLAKSGAAEFVGTIERLKEVAERTTVSELLAQTLLMSGYEKYVREKGDMNQLENIAELSRTVTEWENYYGETYTLDIFLQQITLATAQDREDKADCVRMMTIHTAKGLEFPIVILVGLSEGIFPSPRTIEERRTAGLEEERRLCFVALTRAKDKLYLTDSEGFGNHGLKKLPSRFLFEIPEDLYVRSGIIPDELKNELTSKLTGAAASSETGSPAAFADGERVYHKLFGPGTVAGHDDKAKAYHILFDRSGAKRPIGYEFKGLTREGEPVPAISGAFPETVPDASPASAAVCESREALINDGEETWLHSGCIVRLCPDKNQKDKWRFFVNGITSPLYPSKEEARCAAAEMLDKSL